ncbi:hypothetical protein RIF29_19008 [Crotalaria pallida]|uniref:Uncharacterized protein n=1 Tax=Crotalaria pallida TaxID=3830 RepID=A0AAN9I637_CROPI
MSYEVCCCNLRTKCSISNGVASIIILITWCLSMGPCKRASGIVENQIAMKDNTNASTDPSSFITWIKLIETFTEKDATIHMCTWSARKVDRESNKRAWPPLDVLKTFAVPMHCQCERGKLCLKV